MKIIDGHTHIGQWSSIFLKYKSDIKDAVKIFQSSGVSEAVCMPADAEPNEKLLKDISGIKNFRFHFCAWINPFDKSLDNFLDKNLNSIKFFKIHPSLIRKKVTDKIYKKYVGIAADSKIPLIIHCGRWTDVAGYRFPLKLAEMYPELRVILAHLGGDQPALCISCADEIKNKKFKNVFLGTESVREFYFVNEVVKRTGPEKIIFGSDYNLGLPKMYIPIVESLKITPSEKELIFSGNIIRLLSI